MQRLYWFILLLALPILAAAQTDISRNFTITDGLPSNRVYYCTLDAKGFLWFATDKGVSRYDGYSFENFSTRDGLTDNEVFYVFEDSKQRIWCTTFNGKLSYYHNGHFYNPDNAPFLKQAISEAMFSRVYEDKWGNLLFTTFNNGFYILQGDTFTHYYKGLGFLSPTIYQGQLFINSSSADSSVLYKISPKGSLVFCDSGWVRNVTNYNWYDKDSVYHFSLNEAPEGHWGIYSRPHNKLKYTYTTLKNKERFVPVYTQKKDSIVYVGTSKGLYTYSKGKNALILEELIPYSVCSFTFDFEDNLWVTTLQGGIYFKPNINLKKYREISGNITEIEANPHNGDIWAGNPHKYYKLNNTTTAYTLPAVPAYNEKITAFYFLSANEAIVGSDLSINYQVGSNISLILKQSLSGIKNIAPNPYSKNTVMVSTSSSVSEITKNGSGNWDATRLAGMRSTSVLAIDSQRFFTGSNNGLYLVNRKTGERQLILNDRITHIKRAPDGSIWMCSDVSGLFHYKNGKIKQITEKDGLHTNAINKITFDSYGNVWAATNAGIIKVGYRNNQLKTENYILTNILGREQVNDVELKQDTVLVATTTGLFYLIEKQFKKQPVTPHLIINSINIDGKEATIQSRYKLRRQQNNIQIDFTGISFSTRNINYRYLLQPGNKEWLYTNSRSINLIDLSPGDYNITIQAIKDGSIYSDNVRLEFEIVGPFYATWWFLLLAILFASTVTYIVINYRIQGIRRQASISQIISESKQKALRAQMNPHFLFNSLISIQSFFLNHRNTEGQEYTSKFSKLIRNILDNSDKEQTTIEEEVAMLTNYTDLENIRLKQPFIFLVDIDETVDPYNTPIPTMLLQPIIENAIWHGINYLEGEQGYITLRFKEIENALHITVTDNGVGLKKSAEINTKRNHISKGTTLITERIKAIDLTRKEQITYTVTDNPEGGTIVQLIIPIEE